MILACLPLVPLGAALMTLVAAFTRSYREAQTYVGLMLLVPTLPLVFASVSGLRPTLLRSWRCPRSASTSCITGLLRDEALPGSYAAVSVAVTLLAGALLVFLAGRLYRRESLLG